MCWEGFDEVVVIVDLGLFVWGVVLLNVLILYISWVVVCFEECFGVCLFYCIMCWVMLIDIGIVFVECCWYLIQECEDLLLQVFGLSEL